MSAPVGTRSRRRPLIAAALVVVLVAALGLWWWDEHRKGVTFTAVFSASVGVYPGSDVRILGVPVGRVDSVTAQGTAVRIGMHLDPGVKATAGTFAVIISPNLVSDRYVQLTGVYTRGAALRSGTTIPLARTRTPVELDDLYSSLRQLTDALGPKGANSGGALSRLLDTGSANLAGNGTKINQTITGLSQATGTLAGSKKDIFGTLTNLAAFTRMLKANNTSLSRVNQDLSSVTSTLAADRQTFAQAMAQLATALGLVQRFVHDNRAALSANVAGLNRVARTLAAQRDALVKALQAAPLLVQNFVNAYDAKNNVLRGRVDLNELTLWNANANAAAAAQSQQDVPVSGAGAPPALLPAANTTTGSGR